MQIQVDENISLQPITISHADSMMDLINANRIYLRQWLPWVDNMRTIENAKANIEDCALRAAAKTDFTFVIMFNNKMAGRIGIHHVNQQNKIGEIGYWLADNMQGHGIITKSCVALISYGFQTLGLNHNRYTPLIKGVGAAFSIIVPLIFALMPLAIYFNWIS